MASWINDVLFRLVAIEKECMVALSIHPHAVPYFLYTPENALYFTNRLADNPIADNGSEVEDVDAPVFIARLVVGHITSGIVGDFSEREYDLYEIAAALPPYINSRELLQSAEYPTRPTNFFMARCFNGGGLRVFDNAGIGTQQYGIEFQIRITRDESITQVYL